jgi:predicted deacetylase
MRASYILRFDDICPTMNWSVWTRVESALRDFGIRPIVAVVPKNDDPELRVGPERVDFWDLVREWQHLGWSVAMHGYEHRYSTCDAGITGLNRRSEFAGVSRATQISHIDSALRIFAEHKVYPSLWVAPGHSFDWTTVECLRDRGINVISDGFFSRPVRYRGMIWVPQQLWRFRYMPAGLWTVCSHVNGWSDETVGAFISQLRLYRSAITCLSEVVERRVSDLQIADRLFASLFGGLIKTRRLLSGRAYLRRTDRHSA